MVLIFRTISFKFYVDKILCRRYSFIPAGLITIIVIVIIIIIIIINLTPEETTNARSGRWGIALLFI